MRIRCWFYPNASLTYADAGHGNDKDFLSEDKVKSNITQVCDEGWTCTLSHAHSFAILSLKVAYY